MSIAIRATETKKGREKTKEYACISQDFILPVLALENIVGTGPTTWKVSRGTKNERKTPKMSKRAARRGKSSQ